jgi:hypothetical protein
MGFINGIGKCDGYTASSECANCIRVFEYISKSYINAAAPIL